MPDPIYSQGVKADDLTESKIFISHASADVALAKLLRTALLQGGVPHSRVFYSSLRSTGIPTGQDVVTHLKEQLRGASLVIELISPTFITRPMCLMELGGAWALDKSTFPIVVPPLTRREAVAAIGSFQMAELSEQLGAEGLWNELNDRIEVALGLSLQATAWGEAVADFAESFARLDSSIAEPRPHSRAQNIGHTGSVADSSDARVEFAGVIVRGDQIFGELTNNDRDEHIVSLLATYYDIDGAILGTGGAVVTDLKGGTTKTFTVDSVPTHHRYKLDVATVL